MQGQFELQWRDVPDNLKATQSPSQIFDGLLQQSPQGPFLLVTHVFFVNSMESLSASYLYSLLR